MTARDPGAGPRQVLDVWVVEDNDMLRRSLAALIDEQPDMRCALAVDCCEDFLVALDQDAAPDIVLMDVGLPGRSGIDGIAAIASASPATKTVVLTVHGEDEQVFEAIRAGASGYLLKPSRPQGVIEALREVDRGAAPINGYIASKMLGWFNRLPPQKTDDREYGLTAREKQILQLLVDGLTMNQIATRLELSYHTISNHLRGIYRKLHVRNRAKAVAKALREELI